MKILALGDPHGKLPEGLEEFVKKEKPEALICVGDLAPVNRTIGVPNDKKQAELIREMASFNLPVLTLRGSMYFSSRNSKKIFYDEIQKYKNVHSKNTGIIKIKSQSFILFDFLFEKESARSITPKIKLIMKSNANRKRKLNNLLRENPNSVLITHNPPYGYLDKITSGKHVGSKIIYEAIKKHQPLLVLCGHIHEAEGETRIGKTKVYNLGDNNYKILEI
jgi:hypothetical protein